MQEAFRPKHLTTSEIIDSCSFLTQNNSTETQICIINEELRQGLSIIKEYPKSVTCFGSARTQPNDPYYIQCLEISKRLGELGYTIVTGGGPGLMQAANEGARMSGSPSIGATIRLPFEQNTNPFVDIEIPFEYFFTRKVVLAFSAEAYLVFPGGFGTLDEIFGVLTLIQTKKIPEIPIIFINKEFWKPLQQFIENRFVKENMISEKDTQLYTFSDDIDEIIDIIKKAPQRSRE
jgi:uncharacterized protein (TIGR00730 family)